jgi:DNA-binding FrmR family transcriptional regulator
MKSKITQIFLGQEEKKSISISLKKIIGQTQAILSDIEGDHACDETLTQIMAVRGGISRVGKDLVRLGILDCMGKYTKEELISAIEALYKMD